MARKPQWINTFQRIFSFLYKKDLDCLTSWVELENDQFRYQRSYGPPLPTNSNISAALVGAQSKVRYQVRQHFFLYMQEALETYDRVVEEIFKDLDLAENRADHLIMAFAAVTQAHFGGKREKPTYIRIPRQIDHFQKGFPELKKNLEYNKSKEKKSNLEAEVREIKDIVTTLSNKLSAELEKCSVVAAERR